MHRKVTFRPDQKVTDDDLNNIGRFPRASFDTLVAEAVSTLRYFTGFVATKTGQTEVTVSPGHHWAGGPVYERPDLTVFNMLTGGSYMPTVTKRIVAIVTWGETIDTDVQERSFVIDDEGNTEPQSVSMESLRYARLSLVAGAESPDPRKPTLEGAITPVAWVLLDTSGVVSIEDATEHRLPSVESLHQHVRTINAWRAQVGQAIDTLQSDMAAVQAALYPDLRSVLAWLMSRIEALEALVKKPAGTIQTFVDRFVSLRDSDTEYTGYSAIVDNGLKFPGGESEFSEIALNNPLDPKVKITNNIMLPAWSSTRARLTIGDPDGALSVSQYTSQTTERVQKTASRVVTQYSKWATIGFRNLIEHVRNYGRLFDGDLTSTEAAALESEYARLFDQLKSSEIRLSADMTFKFRRDDGETYTFQIRNWGPKFNNYAIRLVEKVTVEEPYWDTVTRDATVTGSQIAQTFINSTNGWLTEIGLFFDQVAVTGDVKVYLTEVSATKPNRGNVISRGTLNVASLHTNGEIRCQMEPVFLRGGRSYAVLIVSTGNHFVKVRSANKYAYGTAFYLSDTGEWLPVQNSGDICMSLYYPVFDQTRIEVLMQPLTRAGGISAIRINAAQIVPSGTKLLYEIQRTGKWYTISEGELSALDGSPTLVNFRVVFVGTRDLMPALDMSQTEVELIGEEDDFVHISKVIESVSAETDFQVELSIEGWDDSIHDIDIDLIIPGSPDTIEAPDSLTITPMPDDETTVRVLAVFTPDATDEFRVKITGGKDPGESPFVVTERRAHVL